MKKPLVVGIDGSDSSLDAVDWAVAEAVRRALPVRLVHGSLWERYERRRPDFSTASRPGHVMAEQMVGSALERVAKLAPELEVSTTLAADDPAAALLREGRNATAVVLGTRGRGAISGSLLGSTGLRVAAAASCPVVVVRGEPAAVRGEFGRVAVGVGAPGESSAAVEFAFSTAQAREADLLAVHAWHRGLRELPETGHLSGDGSDADAYEAERALGAALLAPGQAHPKVTVHTLLPEGRAHHALIDATTASDLVVVGARRPRGGIGMQLGPVNHAVLHHAACPVAVVPQP